MPYIKKDRRVELLNNGYHGADTPGELNYVLTHFILYYLETHDENYTRINDILGALEGAKLEFYRRVVVPYEEQKITENGDVY